MKIIGRYHNSTYEAVVAKGDGCHTCVLSRFCLFLHCPAGYGETVIKEITFKLKNEQATINR